MQLGRAIHAQSDEEAVRREELTPFVVQERPVGLDRVLDALARSPVLLAQPYRFLEERGSAQCRLAALPADRHSAVRLRIQIAADEPVQHLGGHLLGLVAPQNLLGQEEAYEQSRLQAAPVGFVISENGSRRVPGGGVSVMRCSSDGWT